VRLQWGTGVATLTGVETTQDQQLAFKVRPTFTAQVECTRSNARAGCMPMQAVVVNFAAPVPRDLALGVRIKTRDGKLLSPADTESKSVPMLERVTFDGPFPEETTVLVTLPAGIVDDSARPLANAARFPLELRIDAAPALARFAADFGVLEAKEGGVLPVTLRNVEPAFGGQQLDLPAKMLRIDAEPGAVADWLKRIANANRGSGEWVNAAPEEADGDAATPRSVWQAGRGHRHPAAQARLLCRRDRQSFARAIAPGQGQDALRLDVRTRHEPVCAFQLGTRELVGLGDTAE
jgi:hypothetical protein